MFRFRSKFVWCWNKGKLCRKSAGFLFVCFICLCFAVVFSFIVCLFFVCVFFCVCVFFFFSFFLFFHFLFYLFCCVKASVRKRAFLCYTVRTQCSERCCCPTCGDVYFFKGFKGSGASGWGGGGVSGGGEGGWRRGTGEGSSTGVAF